MMPTKRKRTTAVQVQAQAQVFPSPSFTSFPSFPCVASGGTCECCGVCEAEGN